MGREIEIRILMRSRLGLGEGGDDVEEPLTHRIVRIVKAKVLKANLSFDLQPYLVEVVGSALAVPTGLAIENQSGIDGADRIGERLPEDFSGRSCG